MACIKSVFVDNRGPMYLLLLEFYHGRFLESRVTIVVIKIIFSSILHCIHGALGYKCKQGS